MKKELPRGSASLRVNSLGLAAALVMLVLSLCVSSVAKAATYQVNAKVSAVIPSQAPAISWPTSPITVKDANLAVSGTCQIANPQLLVLLWRGTTFLGSAVCSPTGTFSTTVTVLPGLNIITPKIINITNDAGPDGQVVQVTYVSSDLPVSSETSVDQQLSSSGDNSVNNNRESAAKPVQVVTEDRFMTINSDGEVNLEIVIKNGDAPYTMSVDWGDGNVEVFHFATGGKKTLTHKYQTLVTHQVKLEVTDKNGKKYQLVLGAVTPLSAVPSQTSSNLSKSDRRLLVSILVIGTAILCLLILLLVVASYIYAKKKAKKSKRRKRNNGKG